MEYFDCDECDHYTEDKNEIESLVYTKQGDPLCPECGSGHCCVTEDGTGKSPTAEKGEKFDWRILRGGQ